MEIDEMHTYIQSIQTTNGSGLLLIDVVKQFDHDSVLGNIDSKACRHLWDKVKETKPPQVMTDHCKAYKQVIPKEIHTCSKAETYTIEGYHSL